MKLLSPLFLTRFLRLELPYCLFVTAKPHLGPVVYIERKALHLTRVVCDYLETLVMSVSYDNR